MLHKGALLRNFTRRPKLPNRISYQRIKQRFHALCRCFQLTLPGKTNPLIILLNLKAPTHHTEWGYYCKQFIHIPFHRTNLLQPSDNTDYKLCFNTSHVTRCNTQIKCTTASTTCIIPKGKEKRNIKRICSFFYL